MRAVLFAVLALGCSSTIGPLVTDLQRTPAGEFVVTRCRVRFSQWSNELSTEGCDSRVIGSGGAR